MHKIKLLISSIFLLALSLSSFSQNDGSNEFIRNFERNYDSLLSTLYLRQNSKIIRNTYNRESDNLCSPNSAKNIHDSIFARRLRQLPSSIKLTYNPQVRGIIEYYIDRTPDRVSVMLGLSKYYFPIFEEILDQHNVPHELKYLAVIESALNPNAVSRAGATGLWQFMYSTGRMYDLRINSNIDDRRDPIKSSVAAARYLRDLHRIYNDWELALAAYNCGPGNVNKAIRRSGKKDFWGIYNYLPRETRGYVPAYIAASYVMNYYKEHNIIPAPLSKPAVTDTVLVRKDLHFNQIAGVLNISAEEVIDLNPQYKRDMIMGTQDEYYIKLPIRYINKFISLEDSISEYDLSKYFEVDDNNNRYINKDVRISHKVRRGETWTSIARKYGVTINEVRRWNGNKKYPIAGNYITIHQKQKVKAEEKKEEIAKAETRVEAKTDNKGETKTENKSYKYVTKDIKISHKVVRGETWTSIAKKYNVSISDIRRWNGNAKYPIAGKYIAVHQKKRVKVEEGEEKDSELITQDTEPKAEKKIAEPKTVYHKVRRGDTVSGIAKRYNVPQRDIISLNKLNGRNPIIRVGQNLRVR